jgi:hypothetical protein
MSGNAGFKLESIVSDAGNVVTNILTTASRPMFSILHRRIMFP